MRASWIQGLLFGQEASRFTCVEPASEHPVPGAAAITQRTGSRTGNVTRLHDRNLCNLSANVK